VRRRRRPAAERFGFIHRGVVSINRSQAAIAPGRYRHYKGREYTVLGVARHSETLEDLVVYRQEYGDHGLWVRPATMFTEMVDVDGRSVPRFRLLDE
jgi:hypothetical protein